jgi:hypothetical protein
MATSVDEAIEDVKALYEAATSRTKEKLLEEFAPDIKKMVESEMKRTFSEAISETGKEEENMADKDLDLDIEAEGDAEPYEGEETSAEEKAEEKEEKKEENGEDEDLEISEAALKKVYDEARLIEVQVSKGFKDMTPAGELDDLNPDAGIADVKSGETFHDQKNALPPARKDWTVKEIKQLVAQGMAENRALRVSNKKLYEMAIKLQKTLKETNLFNAKVMVANRILAKNKLSLEQKRTVLSHIDEAKTIDEAKRAGKLVEQMIVQSKAVVAEGVRKPTLSAPTKRAGMLTEGVNKETNAAIDRWGTLAGLTNVGK